MSVSIIEALRNALHNYDGPLPFQKDMAREQLTNSIYALEAGIDPDDNDAFHAFLEKIT